MNRSALLIAHLYTLESNLCLAFRKRYVYQIRRRIPEMIKTIRLVRATHALTQHPFA